MEDEDRPVLRREHPEGSLDEVSILGRPSLLSRLRRDHQDPDVRLPATQVTGFVVARSDEQRVQPGLEPGGVPERPEVSPRLDERSLNGVIGEVGVSKHEASDSVHPVDVAPDEGLKRGRIPGPRRLDEPTLDRALPIAHGVHAE